MILSPFRSFAPALCAMTACLMSAPTVRGGPVSLTPGNLIVTVNDFTGFTYAPVYLAEFKADGTRVQTISTIPPPPGDDGLQEARNNVLAPDGRAIYVYNTTANLPPTLAKYDIAGDSWTQQSAPNWAGTTSAVNGGVGVFGRYVFASNENSADGGILRFNTADGTVDHFGPHPFTSLINLDVSSAGTVFALDGASHVYAYNATTLALEHTFAINFQQNEVIAGASDGSFYVASAQGQIDHYSAAGAILKSITVGNDFFDSIAINEQTGQIALGTAFRGQVVITDLALDTPTSFLATGPAASRITKGDVHVSWVNSAAAVPEPSTLTLFGIAALLACNSRVRAIVRNPRG